MLSSKPFKFWPVCLLVFLPIASAAPQGATPYTLNQVLGLVGDVSADRILQMVKGSCIDFRLTSGNVERLRAAGAEKDLIAGLRSICNKSDSKEGGDVSDDKRRDARRDPPPPKKKPTTITPVYRPPVYTPPVITPATNTTTTGSIAWDFRQSRPLTAGRFKNCQYDYSSAGYTVRVAEYGGSCLDGSMQEWDSNVRVTTQATPVSGGPGYTYGLRFGISDDSTVGYYAFEVSAYGHYELSRYRNNKWETVYPWQTGTGINATSTNTITADIRGSTVDLIINGIKQYTYRAPAPIRGRVGFGIIGFDKEPPFPVVTFLSFNVSGQKSTAIPTVTPTTTTTTNTTSTSVDWDFRSSQPLTAGRYGKCQYDYSTSGYTISVAEAGTTCVDGPLGDQPASVRIATTAVGLRGETGYTYGLRFGYTSDSTIGYYAFEISEGGSFQLSRYRMKQWEPLIPWQKVSAVNPASSGIANNMAVEVRGTSLTLFANGTQVGTYQTPYPAVGPAGFGIIGYEQSGVMPAVRFTRFSTTPLSSNTTTTTVTPTSTAVNWDFRSSQPLSAGRYGKCQYDYSNGGYTVSVAEPGTTCIDGPNGEQPARIRVSATARGLRGGTGYTYGFRLGYTSDQSIGYLAFELSEGGSFQLSRYRNNQWEPLIPWQRVSAVNAASSGLANEMAAEIRGTSLVLYVNGSQVGSYQVSSPPVGPAGFGIIGYDQSLPNPSVVFTRFSITPLY